MKLFLIWCMNLLVTHTSTHGAKSSFYLSKKACSCPSLLGYLLAAMSMELVSHISWLTVTLRSSSLLNCPHTTKDNVRPNSWTQSRHKSQEFSPLLFTVPSTALPCDFYYLKLTQPLTVSTVQLLYMHCKGERRKTWYKTILPSLWFKKSIKNPQVWELSRLCPETSTKFYVHELSFGNAFTH